MREFQADAMMKAQQWEITKGHLWAMVAMQGAYFGGDPRQVEKWQKLTAETDKFIQFVEDWALQE